MNNLKIYNRAGCQGETYPGAEDNPPELGQNTVMLFSN